MPIPFDPPQQGPKTAEVRTADPVVGAFSFKKSASPQDQDLGASSFDPQLRVVFKQPEAPRNEQICGISNRPDGGKYHLVYVNGIRTTPEEAERSTKLIKRAIGVDDCEVSLLYNPIENGASSGIKILGGMASSRLGRKAEPECVEKLRWHLKTVIEQPRDRLIIVGHSHGSLIIQNTLDRVYDSYAKNETGLKKWQQESARIEVILYAPLVRTIVPGPQAVSLLNSLDLPARGLGGMQRMVSATKHYTGWREQQAIQTIIYSPERNRFPDILVTPTLVHDSFDLILDNTKFNFQVMSENPQTKRGDAALFTQNLTESIRLGRRADILHYDLIIKGCDTFGRSFAEPFLARLSRAPDGSGRCIGRFMISGERLERILNAAGTMSNR